MRKFLLIFFASVFMTAWKVGDKADIEWSGVWYRGNIKSTDPQNPTNFCVHYDGWDASYDECGIGSNRLAPLGSKSAANTGPGSAAATGGGGGSNYQYDYCGGKPKNMCPADRGCKWNGSKCVKN